MFDIESMIHVSGLELHYQKLFVLWNDEYTNIEFKI